MNPRTSRDANLDSSPSERNSGPTSYSTAASIESITRGDLEEFHKKWFHPDNFVVAVNGDFDRDEMVQKLEALFANWPFAGEKPPPIPTNGVMAQPGIYIVDKDVNQGRVSIMLPGIRRDNPITSTCW